MNSIVDKLAEQFDASTEFVQAILNSKNYLGLASESTDINSFHTPLGLTQGVKHP